jgi:Putative zinc-finger
MNCREIEPLIYLVREGELTEKEKSMVSEHIVNCPHCEELARSVKAMTSVVLKADYDEDMQVADELFTRQLLQTINKPAGSYTFILVKAAAACLLLLLASTFVMQERSFNNNIKEFQARQQTVDPGLSDCIQELRRKIHYHSLAAFARPDTLQVNLISEEAITAYVRENCGYNASDIKTLKKMLIQAGLID